MDAAATGASPSPVRSPLVLLCLLSVFVFLAPGKLKTEMKKKKQGHPSYVYLNMHVQLKSHATTVSVAIAGRRIFMLGRGVVAAATYAGLLTCVLLCIERRRVHAAAVGAPLPAGFRLLSYARAL